MRHMSDGTPRVRRIVLASQSPRRRRLLAWLGLPYDAVSVDTPEEMDSPLAADPPTLAASLAAEKAGAAREEGHAEDAVVLSFDTIVVHAGRLLGKPVDAEDAWRMLRSLSGRTHEVVTGCGILAPGQAEPSTFSVVTRVRMRELTDDAIEAWMAQGTFLGCAGAYNIEAQVASVTEDECHQNVAGLPLCHLHAALAALPPGSLPGALSSPVAPCDAALGRCCRLGPRVLGAESAIAG